MASVDLLRPGSNESYPPIIKQNTVDMFRECLSVICVNSGEMLDCAFRLRFQVYCLERRFEDASLYPDGREHDAEDWRSLHSLLLDRATGSALGTVRLILPRARNNLPVFRLVGSSERDRAGLPLETTAEVSRFAVAKAFRRQLETGWNPGLGPVSWAPGDRGQVLQLLTFGLIQAVVMMSALGQVTHIVAMMEPALLRMLRRLGIEFHPLGEPVEHHGLRQPGWAVMSHLIASIKNCHPELGEIITDRQWGMAKPPALAHA
jgi:N-acyl amino acid synthase of PEP-CTERM/exosortase system